MRAAQQHRVLDGRARNPWRRYYVRHRRAVTPSVWPPMVIGGIGVAGVTVVVHLGALAAVGLGFLVGSGLARVRWVWWCRRHPVIPVEQYLTDLINEQRRNARWN